MARLLSYKPGAIKSLQQFQYQDSTNANANITWSINEVDTNKAYAVGMSVLDSGNGADIAKETRQVYISSSTGLTGQARNSSGSSSSLYTAGVVTVVEYY
tara:strand:+ start:486 stop:785 length:300 start_codon:yes stop_codon:yes gene_type:complete